MKINYLLKGMIKSVPGIEYLYEFNRIIKEKLPLRFKNISNNDLITYSVFIQALKDQ